MPKTKIQELPNGTLVTSIPRPYAEILGMNKGDQLQWNVNIAERTFSIKKVKV